MTANQISYKNAVETERHNRAMEALQERQTDIQQQSADETKRHNIVYEGETGRHNVVTEGISSDANTIMYLHNLATEDITSRHYYNQDVVAQQNADTNQQNADTNAKNATTNVINANVNEQNADVLAKKTDAEINEMNTQSALNNARRYQTYFDIFSSGISAAREGVGLAKDIRMFNSPLRK